MLVTNYAKIASKYDLTRSRRAIGVDPVLVAAVESGTRNQYRALDLGCGTGNYLKAQIERGPDSVRWDGLDASPDMIQVARGKLGLQAELAIGSVHDLPYADGVFDFIMVRAVFHHFVDKSRALSEICRVLRPGGRLHLRNGAYEYRKQYWVYRYFPETWAIDERRFWPVHRLYEELGERGMRVDGSVHARRYPVDKAEVLLWAHNRDLSQLALLSEDAFRAGLQRLVVENRSEIPTESATVDLSAEVAS